MIDSEITSNWCNHILLSNHSLDYGYSIITNGGRPRDVVQSYTSSGQTGMNRQWKVCPNQPEAGAREDLEKFNPLLRALRFSEEVSKCGQIFFWYGRRDHKKEYSAYDLDNVDNYIWQVFARNVTVKPHTCWDHAASCMPSPTLRPRSQGHNGRRTIPTRCPSDL